MSSLNPVNRVIFGEKPPVDDDWEAEPSTSRATLRRVELDVRTAVRRKRNNALHETTAPRRRKQHQDRAEIDGRTWRTDDESGETADNPAKHRVETAHGEVADETMQVRVNFAVFLVPVASVRITIT